jgi:PTH1 family peptidyl-tRNA hydrolase
MMIIACLGNPGKKYSRNRHNAGFILGGLAAGHYGISVRSEKYSSLTGSGTIANVETMFLFPQTYMNNSGAAVRAALQFKKENPDNLIVLHDEIELAFGEVRAKFGGGHKGNNGVRSIMAELGTGDFHRIRIGVGRPADPDLAVADYLLSNFAAGEIEQLETLLPTVTSMMEKIIAQH